MQLLHEVHLERWPIERLIPYARNARTHSDSQIAQIAGSIAAFGFNNPVLVDPEGGIIAGHGRVLAARQLQLTEVPVIVLAHLSPTEKRAFMLADNKLALNAGWDEEMLCLELQALADEAFRLELTGFGEQELEQLLAEQEAPLDIDEAPEPSEEAVSQRGDLWLLGKHRLFCGDGTAAADLNRVMEGRQSDLVFTDLPYNVNYCGKTSKKLKLANDNLGTAFGDFLNDACRAMLDANAGPIYICMSSGELHRLYSAFTEAGGHWSTYVIWAKNTFTLGRSDYQRQFEPILYGWREGSKHYWCGARDEGDVWFVDKPSVNDLHPTMKPVELIERALLNSSRAGDLVLDPYAGSGSTLMACERQGRQARLVEIDPRYVDVIIRRWEASTGAAARLDQDTRSFAELAAARQEPACC